MKAKDSRNKAQDLLQQGYGTVALNKDSNVKVLIEKDQNYEQLSGRTANFPKALHKQSYNRTKSIGRLNSITRSKSSMGGKTQIKRTQSKFRTKTYHDL